MHYSSLEEWLDYLERYKPESDFELGLERVGAVADTLGLRKPARQIFLVAGTNGKGSTCVFIEALMIAAGYTVGTTLSPHLSSFTERIRVAGEPVNDALLCDALNAVEAGRVATVLESAKGEVNPHPHLSYFEFVILAALQIFKHQLVDVCVLEIGLGGRLDAANLVDPDVSVITSVGLDHTEFLGETRELIAVEKAGIMRAGIPCVYGESDLPESISACSRSIGAELYHRGQQFFHMQKAQDWYFENSQGLKLAGLPLPLISTINAATAIQAVSLLLELSHECVAQACKTVFISGRFERRSYQNLDLILDVAHNPHAAGFLSHQLAALDWLNAKHKNGMKTACIAGFLGGKDAAGVVTTLADSIDEWTFVNTGAGGYAMRGQSGEKSAELVKAHLQVCSRVSESVESALNYYLNATHRPDRVVILGSFDVVQQAHEILGSRRSSQ